MTNRSTHDYLRDSVSRIIGLQLLFTLILLIVAAASFGYYVLRADLQSKVDIISARVTAEMSTMSSSMQGLAQSPVSWTALTDAVDRGIYLTPLLEGLNQAQTFRLGILDPQGYEFVLPPDFFIDPETLRLPLTDKPAEPTPLQAFIRDSDADTNFLLITPIMLPMSEQVVGYAVGAYGLARALRHIQATVGTQVEVGFSEPATVNRIELKPFALSLATRQVVQTPNGDLALFVRVTDTFKSAFIVLIALSFSVLLVGLYARRVGTRWAAGFAKKLFERLDLLVEQSREIWRGKRLTAYQDDFSDEISEIRNTLIKLSLEQKLALDQLKTAARIYETAGEAILVVDQAGCITNVNAALLAMTGHDEGTLLGQTAGLLYVAPGASAQAAAIETASFMQRGDWRGEALIYHKAGWSIPVQLAASIVKDTDGLNTGMVAVFSDIREIKFAQEQLRDLAYKDALTSLPNYRAFIDFFKEKVNQDRGQRESYALMFFDVDRLKQVNDLYGRDKGDEVIQVVARHLGQRLPPGHFLVRRGAGEFLALVPLENDGVLDSMRLQIGPELTHFKVDINPLSLEITCSTSITTFDQDAPRVDLLLQQVSFAMREAKRQAHKGGVVWYDDALGEQVERNLKIKAALPTAIRESQIELHFQPEVDLATGAIVGFEALARWFHPQLKAVRPDEFIDAAEQSDWIVELSDLLLEKVVNSIAPLQQRFPGTKVAFNASPRLFANNHLLESVRAISKTEPALLNSLVIEVTETSLSIEESLFNEQLERIKALGVQIAIDDFGKGHSSLARLAGMRIDKFKIDAGFVAGIGAKKQEDILDVLVSLGKTLDATITAEGVETPSQAAWLRSAGCTNAQGWLFSEALPIDEVLLLTSPLTGRFE